MARKQPAEIVDHDFTCIENRTATTGPKPSRKNKNSAVIEHINKFCVAVQRASSVSNPMQTIRVCVCVALCIEFLRVCCDFFFVRPVHFYFYFSLSLEWFQFSLVSSALYLLDFHVFMSECSI